MDYSKMSDFEINKAVAEIAISGDWFLEPTDESPSWFFNLGVEGKNTVKLPDYCNNPADAWPIIESNRIGLSPSADIWHAYSPEEDFVCSISNPLRAAMIVFLMMQDSANVPVNSTGSDLL